MTTVNHECYASLEVAKLLKKAGFDWECRGYFDGTEFHPNGSVECTNYNSNTCKYLKVPVLDVAQRWLREVKHVEVLIEVKYLPHTVYYARVEYEKYGYVLGTHSTYEETQEAGIKKALEIILEEEK